MATAESRIKKVLREKYPGAKVTVERVGPGGGIYVVVTEDFAHKKETKRQDEIWAWLKEKLDFEDIRHIGFILTMTPDEEKAYAE